MSSPAAVNVFAAVDVGPCSDAGVGIPNIVKFMRDLDLTATASFKDTVRLASSQDSADPSASGGLVTLPASGTCIVHVVAVQPGVVHLAPLSASVVRGHTAMLLLIQLPVATLPSEFIHFAPVISSTCAGHESLSRPFAAQLPVAVPSSEFVHFAPVPTSTVFGQAASLWPLHAPAVAVELSEFLHVPSAQTQLAVPGAHLHLAVPGAHLHLAVPGAQRQFAVPGFHSHCV